MKLSARNQLKGKIVSITTGAVNTEVVIELPSSQQIVSIITNSAAQALDLATGKESVAVIKASSVMIAMEE